jgi:hypothetical protein
MGNQILDLSSEDIAGGFKTMSEYTGENAGSHLGSAKEAVAKIDVKNGWTPFVESATTHEAKLMLVKAPAGVGLYIVSTLCWAIFCAIVYTAKVGTTKITSFSSRRC